jgi:hypothetical protein
MQKTKYFMTFYEDLALLHSIANKQTLFLAAMIGRMDADNVVQMTPYIREQIMNEIGTSAKNKLAVAKQYINSLIKAGLITNIGRGAYMVVPKLFGFSNFVNSINEKQGRFIKIRYENDKRTIEVGVDE